jgi:hypothetical protein
VIRDSLQAKLPHGKRGSASKQRRQISKLPSIIPQYTFQEVRNLTRAITDGATLRNWSEIHGETALKHSIEGQPIETKLEVSNELNWWDNPATHNSLRQELQGFNLESILLFHFALEAVLSHQHAMLVIDDLICEIGWTPRSIKEREEMRRQIYRWLCLFTNLSSWGIRPGMYQDPLTKKRDRIVSNSCYFVITDKEYAEQQLKLDG